MASFFEDFLRFIQGRKVHEKQGNMQQHRKILPVLAPAKRLQMFTACLLKL